VNARKGRVDLPAELHAMASTPAMPAIPAVLTSRHAITGEPVFKLVPPSGGHALLDLYFCSFAQNIAVQGIDLERLEEVPNEELDRLTRFAWRLAVSAVRTRPDTGPVPAGVPLEGV